jgi:hypothetical protein
MREDDVLAGSSNRVNKEESNRRKVMPKQLEFGEGRTPQDIGRRNAAEPGRKATLGPKGRNVVLDKKWGAPDRHQRRRERCQRNRTGRQV